MTYSPNIPKKDEVKVFKKRNKTESKLPTLTMGVSAICFYREGRFEGIYFRRLKKILKKYFKNPCPRYFHRWRMCWLFAVSNFNLSKKSKNARMGKGRGGMVKWVFRIKANSKFLEFTGFSYYRLKYFLYTLQCKTNLPLILIKNNDKIKNTKQSLNQNFTWII